MIRTITLLLLISTSAHAQYYHGQYYDQRTREYRSCPRVDPFCELLPRQGFPLQPTPREKREAYEAAHDLALQRHQQRAMTQEQWKRAIIDEANKYCTTYPRDEICHFKEPLPDERQSPP